MEERYLRARAKREEEEAVRYKNYRAKREEIA